MTTGISDRLAPVLGAQYYPVARLVHLERVTAGLPMDLIYSRHRQDWNPELADSNPRVYRCGLFKALVHFWNHDYRYIEIPEPLALPVLPHALLSALLIKLKNFLKHRDTKIVFYAIENLDQAQKLAATTRVPYVIAAGVIRPLAGAVVRATHRIAYGTAGTRDNYRNLMGSIVDGGRHTEVRDFEALPSPDPEPVGEKNPELVMFLGSFETRKGIDRVMSAWDSVVRARPSARLIVVGHGPLEPEVLRWASAQTISGVSLEVDPPRARIRELLRAAHCLVLPSVRTPTWREQVGLPIVEALAQGCEIVTTDETGIAAWLAAQGHQVVDVERLSDSTLSDAIVAALGQTRSPLEVQASLPQRDSRLSAELWMFESAAGT